MLNRRLLRTKVLRSLYAHSQNSERRAEATLLEYRRSAHQCYVLYAFLLQLLVEITNYGKARQAIAKTKLQPTTQDLNPNTRFVENRVIASIAGNSELQKLLGDAGLRWADYESEALIRDLYNSIVGSEKYEVYMDGAIGDRAFVQYILANFLEDNSALESLLDEVSILWADDLGYALSVALNSVERRSESTLLPQFSAENQDEKYAENLLLHSIKNLAEYRIIIEELSDNWEIERIADMDILILCQATAELVSCPKIPIKVTMNEYIEISKFYSTPSSYNFVNGVLHRVVERMVADGRINKTGRGLQ